jgi:polysaccharide biosynthesis protein PslG
MKKILALLLVSLSLSAGILGQTRKYPCITCDKFQASGPGLKQIGFIAVKHSKDIQSSLWSVGCETLDRDYAKFSVYKDYVGELGVKHARLQSGWAKCEKEKGVYNFAWLDSCVYGLSEQGVKPWMCLCYGNPVYGSGSTLGTGVAALAHSEEGMKAWLKYVEVTVNRYKNVINEWEIWNEPYGQEKDYAPLLIQTAKLIKKTQPGSLILGEILTDSQNPGDKILLDAVKNSGNPDLVDYWAYHPYTGNPDNSYPAVEKLKIFLQSYNPKYKVYQGEVGCPSALEWTHALANYPWTEISQAKWIMRRMAGDRVRNIPSSVFTIIDLKYTNMLQSFGLIRSNLLNEFIYKRPSFYAVQHMVSFFDDTAISVGEIDYQSNSERKITVAGFKKEGNSVALIWFNDHIPTDDLKWDLVNLNLNGLNFNDPVYVEMITGKVFEIGKENFTLAGNGIHFKNLPLWDSAVMVAERSLVGLK